MGRHEEHSMLHRAVAKAPRVVVAGLLAGLSLTLYADSHIFTNKDQAFHVGDTGVSTICQDITLSCEGGDVGAGGNPYIVQAPTGVDWNTGVTPTLPSANYNPSTLGSSLGAVTFIDSKHLRVAITAPFSPGNSFVVHGARFTNFQLNSTAAPLTASTNNGVNYIYSDGGPPSGSIRVAANPTASMTAQNNPPLSPGGAGVVCNNITITEAASNPAIWATTGIRISIPAGLGVSWSNSVTTLTGPIFPKMTGTGVTYTNNSPGDGGNLTAVIIVNTDFAALDQAIIRGLKFNVLASAADNAGFSLNICVGGPNNTATHATCGPIVISGTPNIQSPASQTFTVGDLPSPTGTMTVTETSGTPKMTSGRHLRLVIPSALSMTWDAGTLATITAPVTGTGALTLPPTIITTTNANDTLDFPIATSFTSNSSVAITGAQFANFSAASAPGNLQLFVTGTVFNPQPTDNRTRAIGQPLFTSAADQDFLQAPPGVTPVAMAQITITDDGVTPRLTGGQAIKIRIPAGFTMSWNNDPPGTAVLGGHLSGATVAYQSFNQPNDTLVLTPTGSFGASGVGTIGGLNFAIGSTASLPSKLHMFLTTTDPNSVALADAKTITVGGRPTITSGSNQVFTANDPSTLANQITITDSPASASILAPNILQVVIPSTLNFTWDTTVTSPTVTGTASAKVTLPFSYSVDSKTLKIPVNTSFATNDTLILNNLKFKNFSGCAPAGLQVTVTATGPVAATDTFTKAVGAPTIASAVPQAFGKNDPSSVAAPITITDDPVTPRLLSGSSIQVWIPASLAMKWDPAFVPVIGVTGNGAVGVPTFANANQTLVIPITTSFTPAGPGQTVTITGAHFNNFSAVSAASFLEFFINGGVPPALPNAFDTQSIKIGTRPNVTSVVTADNDGNGSIDHLVVTFDKPIQSTTSVTLGTGFTAAGYTILGGGVAGNVVTFALRELGLGDTNATPLLTYASPPGNLVDTADGLGLISAIPPTQDGAAPVIVNFSTVDANANGFLDAVVFTFSEPLAVVPQDITNWTLIDANGTTNLLAGLPNSAVVVSGNQVTITLGDNSGTAGTPRYRYQWNGLATGHITDLAGTPNNAPTLTNNHAPVAVVGAPLTVLPTRVTLDASGSFDPDNQPVNFSWSQVGGVPAVVTLNNPTSSKPNAILTTPGTYTFQVIVSDGLDSTTKTTTVTVLNIAPTAVAILNMVTPIQPTTLYGFLSSDVNGDPLTYMWTEVSRPAGTPAVVISNSTSAYASFTPTAPGTYVFKLTVTDTVSNSSSDQVTIKVNSGTSTVPTANAGANQVIALGSTATLDGRLSTRSAPVGPPQLNYTWSPGFLLSSPVVATPTFTPTNPGLYTFQLVVTDQTTGIVSAPSSVSVLVHAPGNNPPVSVAAKASPFGVPIVGDLVTLDGTGSVDPEGAPLQYAWSQVEGPAAAITGLSTAQPTFTPVFAGSYTFQLVVSDGVQQGFPSRVTFQVTPDAVTPPVSLTPTLTTPVDPVTGHVDFDGVTPIAMYGTIFAFPIEFWWEQTMGPTVVFNPVFTGDASGTITFVPPRPGHYQFSLNPINDLNFLRSSATLDVVVDFTSAAPPILAPIANAGTAQNATAGQMVTLNGSGSSPGTPGNLYYYWTQIAGPSVVLSDPSTASPSFTPPSEGIYVFSLTVRNDNADTLPSTVQVTVAPGASKASGGGGGSGGGGCGSLGLEPLLVLGLASWILAKLKR
jgi:hypothetical protein